MWSPFSLVGFFFQILIIEIVRGAYNNSHIIDVLEEIDSIKSPRVIDAMIHVDRGYFTAHNDSRKYMLAARDIGFGSIIDNPVQHAEVLELLHDKLVPGAKVLDVGSGSGYLTTCFAHMVGKNGSVVGVEHIPEIVTHASNATTRHYPKLNKRIKFVCQDGRLGYPEGGPYDVIHVGASCESVPKAFVDQLNRGGKMYINVRYSVADGKVYTINKRKDGTLRKKFIKAQKSFNNMTSRFSQLKAFRERWWMSKFEVMWPYKKPHSAGEQGLSFECPDLNQTEELGEGESFFTEFHAPMWESGVRMKLERIKQYGPDTLPPENTDMSYLASSLYRE